jgi:hypothetical protein
MTIIEWANRELEVLTGHLAYLKSGAARFYDQAAHADRTKDCIAMLERQIEEWKALMDQHGIIVSRPNTSEA